MTKRVWLVPVFAIVALCCAQAAQAQEKLEWKVFDGKKEFYQKLETTTKQKLTVNNVSNEQTQTQTFWFKWTPKGKDGGNWKVEQTIVGLAMDIQIGGNKISYKSWENNPNNPMSNFFKQLIDHTFTLHIDPKTLEVKKVEGVDDLVNKLGKVNQAMKPLLKEILSESAVKEMARPILAVAPPGGVVPKDGKWEIKSKLDMGPIGVYKTTNTYSVKKDDLKKDIVPIAVKSSLVYEPPSKEKAGQLPFEIEKAELKSTKAEGEVKFNRKVGRIESSTMNVDLDGKLWIKIAGTTTEVALVQNQSVVMNAYDPENVPDQWLKDKIKGASKEKK